MITKGSIFRISALVFTVFVLFSGVNSLAPGPAPSCNDALPNMSSCLGYVTDSNVTTPDPDCCPALESLYGNMPLCLCQLIGTSGDVFGIAINRTKAFMLPDVCAVSGADPSLCSLFGIPVPSPNPGEGPSSGPEIMIPASGASVAPPPENNSGCQSVCFSSMASISGLVAAAAMAIL